MLPDPSTIGHDLPCHVETFDDGSEIVAVTAVPVILDEPTRADLQRIVRSGTSQVRAVLRARIVLAAADGVSNTRIAVDLRTGHDTVRKWRGRFATAGLAGLADAQRSGRPRRYGAEQRVQVVAVATSVPPYPEATWSHRRIAQQLADLAISASQVGRILADCDLRPHRVRGWLTRKDDPLFWSRATDVCDLYLNPPPGAVVLSIDEKTAIAARSRKHPGQAATPGRAARQEFEYIRHGTVSIIAALNVLTGEVLTETITRNDSATFQNFLTMLDRHIDPTRQIHVVLDNGSSHVAKATREFCHCTELCKPYLFLCLLTIRASRPLPLWNDLHARKPTREKRMGFCLAIRRTRQLLRRCRHRLPYNGFAARGATPALACGAVLRARVAPRPPVFLRPFGGGFFWARHDNLLWSKDHLGRMNSQMRQITITREMRAGSIGATSSHTIRAPTAIKMSNSKAENTLPLQVDEPKLFTTAHLAIR